MVASDSVGVVSKVDGSEERGGVFAALLGQLVEEHACEGAQREDELGEGVWRYVGGNDVAHHPLESCPVELGVAARVGPCRDQLDRWEQRRARPVLGGAHR